MHESTFPLLEDCSIAVFVHVGCLGHRRCTLLKKYSITYNCRLRPGGWITPAPCPWEAWKLTVCCRAQLCRCLLWPAFFGSIPALAKASCRGFPRPPPVGHSPFTFHLGMGIVGQSYIWKASSCWVVGGDLNFLFCFCFLALFCVIHLGFNLMYVIRWMYKLFFLTSIENTTYWEILHFPNDMCCYFCPINWSYMKILYTLMFIFAFCNLFILVLVQLSQLF